MRETASCATRRADSEWLWGCNLPAVTPPGELFEPAWQENELIAIRRVLEAGLELFESELRTAGVGA